MINWLKRFVADPMNQRMAQVLTVAFIIGILTGALAWFVTYEFILGHP